jgi:hypothetical protein
MKLSPFREDVSIGERSAVERAGPWRHGTIITTAAGQPGAVIVA